MIIRWLLKWMKSSRIKYWQSTAKKILRGFARSGAWIAGGMVIYALMLVGSAFYLSLLAVVFALIICSKPKKKGGSYGR